MTASDGGAALEKGRAMQRIRVTPNTGNIEGSVEWVRQSDGSWLAYTMDGERVPGTIGSLLDCRTLDDLFDVIRLAQPNEALG